MAWHKFANVDYLHAILIHKLFSDVTIHSLLSAPRSFVTHFLPESTTTLTTATASRFPADTLQLLNYNRLPKTPSRPTTYNY